MMKAHVYVWVLSAALVTASGARAQEGDDNPSAFRASGALLDASPQARQSQLSVWLLSPWYYGFGAGAGVRYMIPIVPNGFIPTLNDSFELEFGGDFWASLWSPTITYYGLTIPAEALWTFHLVPAVSVYGKLALGFNLYFSSAGPLPSSFIPLYFNLGPGVLWHVGQGIDLRAELGYGGARIGLGFKF